MSATYTGKNVDAAIQKAAAATGIAADSLNYEVLAGQTGGFALIRVVGKKVAQAPLEEQLTGEAGADDGEAAPRRERSDRGDRGGDRGGDRRGGDRGGDRGGERRSAGGRNDRGDRGDRGDRPRREPREEFWPIVAEDGGREVTVAFADDVTQEGRDAADLLKTILEKMGFGMALKVAEDESRVVIDLQSEIFASHFEARELELTQSLEVLVDKGLPYLEGDKQRKKLTLDVNGEKARAEIELATTARTFADKAIAQGKIFKLGPLDPRDRRIVHMTLKGYPGVVTRSEGEGLFRRVGIIPDALVGGDDDQD